MKAGPLHSDPWEWRSGLSHWGKNPNLLSSQLRIKWLRERKRQVRKSECSLLTTWSIYCFLLLCVMYAPKYSNIFLLTCLFYMYGQALIVRNITSWLEFIEYQAIREDHVELERKSMVQRAQTGPYLMRFCTLSLCGECVVVTICRVTLPPPPHLRILTLLWHYSYQLLQCRQPGPKLGVLKDQSFLSSLFYESEFFS